MNATVPVLPESAPFSVEQRAWLNGFLAGLLSRGAVDPIAARRPVAPAAAALQPLTILFGSQTGTAETLAKRLAKEAGKRGFAPTVRDMGDVQPEHLAQERNLLVITSTYGEGEPPDNAKALHAALRRRVGAAGPDAPRWPELRFSVCGLGDRNYVHFCRCARELDVIFEQLGARRVAGRAECDVDYEAPFAAWSAAALTGLADPAGQPAPAPADDTPAVPSPDAAYTRTNPYPALVRSSHRLSGAGSAKQVHHVEFDLAEAGLTYEAGDALGVYAHNCPELVADVLGALGCDGEEAVPAPDGRSVALRLALTECYDLGRPTEALLERVEAHRAGLARSTADAADAAGAGAAPHHVIDALLAAPTGAVTAVDFVGTLSRLQPRLYSISSSPRAHPGEVHLTVGAVRYEKDGRRRKGVCSTCLADRVLPGVTRLGVFVHANRAFRPPADPGVPMIMIGPGTGIAPFRGFLHERRAAGAAGRHWLFFGDQRGATDFLYRDELEAFRREGLLTRLDTAFSRDQPEKVYVQHRMLEHAAELYAWLEEGAHVYVCGDATRMAKDVEAALHEVIVRGGDRTAEQAVEYVDRLRAAKRYCRDVY
jgi:sulfite reductase (NADPH) flavoprotein alpha-component